MNVPRLDKVSVPYLDGNASLVLDRNQTLLEQLESVVQNSNNGTQIHIFLDGDHLSDYAFLLLKKRAGVDVSVSPRKSANVVKKGKQSITLDSWLENYSQAVEIYSTENDSGDKNSIKSSLDFYFSQSNTSGKNQKAQMSKGEFAESIFNLFRYLKVKNVTKVTLRNFGKQADEVIEKMNEFFASIHEDDFNETISISKSSYMEYFYYDNERELCYSRSSTSSETSFLPLKEKGAKVIHFGDIDRLESDNKLDHIEKYEACLDINPIIV